MKASAPKTTDLALDAFVKLQRAAESVVERTARGYTAMGLTTSQFGVLEALLHLGPLTQTGLARKILKTSGNMTMVVDNLERRGLVRRERSTTDRRVVTVSLTEEGRALITQLFPSHAHAINQEMGALTPGEQAELARLCKKLGTPGG